jgi:hypothetical protein
MKRMGCEKLEDSDYEGQGLQGQLDDPDYIAPDPWDSPDEPDYNVLDPWTMLAMRTTKKISAVSPR